MSPSAPPVSQAIYDPFQRLAGGSGAGDLASLYDVRAYGAAVGFDVAAPLLAAVAAADAAGGGTVLVPTSYPISAATISVTNPVTILGLPGTTLTQYDANNLSPVLSLVSSNVTLDGLHVTGSVAAGHESDEAIGCIQLTYVGAPITLDSITIRNCRCDGKNSGIESYNGAAAFALTKLLLEHNTIRTLHRGILIGPYGRNAVVNDRITARFNDIEVSATGGYANFQYARPLWIINTNNLEIHNNRSIGGFGAIETFAGGVSGPRPRQRNVNIYDNPELDGHIGFTQIDGGRCSGNVVDMSLRNPAWPKFDNATVLASWGYLAGIEADDMNDAKVYGNTVRGQVGHGIDFGGCEDSVLGPDNTVDGTGVTLTPPTYAHGVWLLNTLQRSKVIGNTIRNTARSGIGQATDASYMTLFDCEISGNVISATVEHGIHLRNAVGLKLDDNTIVAPNGAAGAFDAINFSSTFITDIVRYFELQGNRTDGGRYAIYNEYADGGATRGSIIMGNVARNVTNGLVSPNSRSYVIRGGRRRMNVADEISNTQGLVLNHLDFSTARDLITLDPGGADNFQYIDYGTVGDIVIINFARGDTLVVNGLLVLSGGANVTPTAGSVMMFVCVNDTSPTLEAWKQITPAMIA